MIEQIKYFTQRNGNVTPMARSDAEWHGTYVELSLDGYKYKVREREICSWGEKVGKRS